jgi:hypothetical protein
MQRHVFPSSHPHPQLQAVEAIQPAYALGIDRPAFTSEKDPDPQIPEARALVRDRANPTA